MSAVEAVVEPWMASDVSDREWAALSARAPQLTATMRRYLVQLATFLAQRSVVVAEGALRQLARWLADGAERHEEVLGVTVPEMRYRRTLD